MVWIIAATALAWGFARVLEAPRWVEWCIPLVALGVTALCLVALPGDSAFRQSVAGGARALGVLALVVVPVAGYLVLVRRLKAKVQPQGSKAAVITDLSLIHI